MRPSLVSVHLVHQALANPTNTLCQKLCNKQEQACVRLARTIYIYTVYLRYFWQGSHQIYGHTRSIDTVLASPRHVRSLKDVTNLGAVQH
jgi:hypothetical protein